MYCVVETIEEGERNCIAVPSIWVNNSTLNYPSQSKDVNSARKKCMLPQINWIQMPCTVLRDNIATLKDALEKERECSIVSCSETEVSGIYKQMPYETVNFTEVFLRNINSEDLNRNPPVTSELTSLDSNSSPLSIGPSSSAPESIVSAPISTVTQFTSEDKINEHQRNFNCNANDYCYPQPYEDVLLQRLDNAMSLFKNQTNQILKNQAALQASLDLLWQKMPSSKEYHPLSEKPDIDLPISTVDSLDSCDEKLKNNPDFRRQMIAYMSSFGGPHTSGCARNIMKTFIHDNILKEFSWTGTGVRNKRPFLPYKNIQHVLLQAVRGKFPEFTDHENTRFLKDYLKSANTRILRAAERGKTN